MYSGLDRKVHFSQEDLAMGAIDLAEEEVPVFNTIVNKTLAVVQELVPKIMETVKEAAPKFIETMVSQLVPVSPVSHQSRTITRDLEVVHPPEVYVAPPVVPIIVVPGPFNQTSTSAITPTILIRPDTV
jgi:hypothetical protein